MSICFIADLHLSADRPEIAQRFLHFLQQEATQHRTLYILGDLFEVWLGDDLSSQVHANILYALKRVTETGTAIYVQHGNRDFLLGRQFEELSGCQLLEDPYLIDLESEQILLMHGDQLCSDDLSYQKYRKWVRNRFSLWVLRHLPKSVRRRVGTTLRQRSEYGKQQKSVEIMDVTQDTVEAVTRQGNSTHLGHGHTHRPGYETFRLENRLIYRLVLGDWGASQKENVWVFSEGEFSQRHY